MIGKIRMAWNLVIQIGVMAIQLKEIILFC